MAQSGLSSYDILVIIELAVIIGLAIFSQVLKFYSKKKLRKKESLELEHRQWLESKISKIPRLDITQYDKTKAGYKKKKFIIFEIDAHSYNSLEILYPFYAQLNLPYDWGWGGDSIKKRSEDAGWLKKANVVVLIKQLSHLMKKTVSDRMLESLIGTKEFYQAKAKYVFQIINFE